MDVYTDAQKDFQEREIQKYVDDVKEMLGDILYNKNQKNVIKI